MNHSSKTEAVRGLQLSPEDEIAVEGRSADRSLDPARAGGASEEFRKGLLARVVGQDEAIDQIVDTYETYLAGLTDPDRPIANLLFLGPTGTGKTRLVEATAETLLGTSKAVIKIDCGEFQHSHEIAKLIGSPPGYIGHRETHPSLSQQALNLYHTDTVKISIVLFDEIEKASDALWHLLLGILDKATLTLGDNQKVDFSQAMIFMTSNLGAAEMESTLRRGLGFAPVDPESNRTVDRPQGHGDDRIAGIGIAAARRRFTPEFINRLDKILVFRSLGEAELRKILDVELGVVQRRVLDSQKAPFVFFLTEAAKDVLIAEGTDVKYGARPLKRAVHRTLVNPLSKLIISEQARPGDLIRVDYSQPLESFTFSREAEKLTSGHMTKFVNQCAGCKKSPRWIGSCWVDFNTLPPVPGQCPAKER